jgi:hypothetical protein
MSNEEELSSKILSNVDIIADIYKIVKDAGIKATANPEVQATKNNTTIIKANVRDLNRSSANCKYPKPNMSQCRTSKEYSITYDANDMMIVGGSALNVYDYLLKELKERREMKALEEYIKKRTSDIDIVWWPRMVTNSAGNIIETEIVTSTSPAINIVVQVFIREVIAGLEEQKVSIQTKLKRIIPNATNADNLVIDVGGDFYEPGKAYHNYKSGTHTVVIKFKIKGREFKICEILVHDSGASQQFDESGLPITDLRYMTTDPVYCSPVQSSPNPISYQVVNEINIAVPNILSFVKQQMLAFSNLITNNKDREGRWNFKAFINYKRVEFIKKILQNIKVDDERNKKDLLEVFKTSNTNYPGLIVTNINTIETRSIDRLYIKILELCSNYNSSSDPIVTELCERAGRRELELWADKKEKELEQLKDKIRFKRQAKNGTTSSIRQAYYDLERKAESYKLIISRMPNDERPINVIKKDSLYTNDPIKEILNEEAELNKQAKPSKSTKQPTVSQDARVDPGPVPRATGVKPSVNKSFGLLPTPPPETRGPRMPIASSMPMAYSVHPGYVSMPAVQTTRHQFMTNQFGTTYIWNPHIGYYEVYRPAPPPLPPSHTMYGAPYSGYGGPASGYGGPPSGYGGPPSGYGAPPSDYGRPGSRRKGGAPNFIQLYMDSYSGEPYFIDPDTKAKIRNDFVTSEWKNNGSPSLPPGPPIEISRNNRTQKNRKRNNYTKKRV